MIASSGTKRSRFAPTWPMTDHAHPHLGYPQDEGGHAPAYCSLCGRCWCTRCGKEWLPLDAMVTREDAEFLLERKQLIPMADVYEMFIERERDEVRAALSRAHIWNRGPRNREFWTQTPDTDKVRIERMD